MHKHIRAWYHPHMKGLFLGIVFIIIVGFGGLVYRNAVEHPNRPIACPMDALVCPDGTSVGRTGNSCTFAPCPLPNVTLADIGISFAVPTGFIRTDQVGAVAVYTTSATSSEMSDSISITQYWIDASSTALATIQKTAISDGSGLPVPVTSYTSSVLGNHRFTVVQVGRFEGVVATSYYLARATDVLRFDAIDKGVMNWTDSNLDPSKLPAHAALVKLLSTLQER